MNVLRQHVPLRLLALLWFVLSVGVSTASPLVRPLSIQLVCSGTTVKLVVDSGDGMKEMGAHTMDCALCLPSAAPPPARYAALPPATVALAYVTRSIPAARLAAAVAAPLPARGPPALA